MKIGLNGGASTVDRIVEQAVETEADGFHSLWYPSAVAGDPLVAIAFAGRATTTLELGTAVLQTYSSHPALMANRVLAVVAAMGRNGFTLGIGPSHEPVIEGSFGLSYATPGRHTEEYVTILAQLLHGEAVEFHGDDFDVRLGAPDRRARSNRAVARCRARVTVAARCGRGGRRHDPLDGQRARDRHARRAH